METHNNASNGLEISGQEISRKHRNKSKVSNLQARLSPNFNLRDILKPKNDRPYAKNYLQSHNEEKLDPKIMTFATLVTFLHPLLIVNYLRKILNFLNSNQCQLSFSNITPYLEEFLTRIVQDNAHLTCSMFTGDGKETGKLILNILEQNKHRYKWEYAYEGGSYVDK